jgi:hypothetical protein
MFGTFTPQALENFYNSFDFEECGPGEKMTFGTCRQVGQSPTVDTEAQLGNMSTSQLKSMLQTNLDPTDAEFEAARQAREKAQAQGLTGDALFRQILIATIQAKQQAAAGTTTP